MEFGEEACDWLDQARMSLLVVGDLIKGGHPREAIADSFTGMLYAARAALGGGGSGVSGWEDVVRLFQEEALPALGLSKENQRALVIVADLYTRVICSGEMEADPVTAAACLDDAWSFVREIESAVGTGMGD